VPLARDRRQIYIQREQVLPGPGPQRVSAHAFDILGRRFKTDKAGEGHVAYLSRQTDGFPKAWLKAAGATFVRECQLVSKERQKMESVSLQIDSLNIALLPRLFTFPLFATRNFNYYCQVHLIVSLTLLAEGIGQQLVKLTW
jgi:hypothetical protein